MSELDQKKESSSYNLHTMAHKFLLPEENDKNFEFHSLYVELSTFLFYSSTSLKFLVIFVSYCPLSSVL